MYAELEKMALEYYKQHANEKTEIDKRYRSFYESQNLEYTEEILNDELTAHYIETMLEKRNVLAKLSQKQPNLLQRCIKWLKTRLARLVGIDKSAADEVDMLARKFVSTFNLNKGKIGQQDKAQYALRKSYPGGVDLIDNYTEKQYNDFGWARVNGVLSYRENGNFRAKYGEIKSGKQSGVHRTSKGEIIVAVNDMEKGKFGVNNVLVFAKGTYENYKITRVIRLKSNSETHLDIVRGFIYEYENDTNAQTRYTLEELYSEELIEQYDSRDFDDYRTSKARARARGRGNQSGGSEQDSRIGTIGKGNTDSDSNNGIKRSYALSVVDSDGKALSKEQQDYFKDSKVRDEDGNLLIVPVKLEVKEFTDKQNTLYIAIALESIKKTKSSRKGIPIMALPNTLVRLILVYPIC